MQLKNPHTPAARTQPTTPPHVSLALATSPYSASGALTVAGDRKTSPSPPRQSSSPPPRHSRTGSSCLSMI
ncbi:hypothetical protein GUJ93_ZPchr0013g34957 [Zizania palustris]|uniref:Uncharacterized protein n=1 Tax=Zizania palustris TaxID=103762 RepID=A0A8J6BUB5_ZIZPA|nr:hypothetical protein GUJ93_ZPchr0013g34957 [Zizania palustris]